MGAHPHRSDRLGPVPEEDRSGQSLSDRRWRKAQAELVEFQHADVIILNEVDLGMKRTEYADVAHELAEAGGMNYAFGIEFVEVDPFTPGSADRDADTGAFAGTRRGSSRGPGALPRLTRQCNSHALSNPVRPDRAPVGVLRLVWGRGSQHLCHRTEQALGGEQGVFRADRQGGPSRRADVVDRRVGSPGCSRITHGSIDALGGSRKVVVPATADG